MLRPVRLHLVTCEASVWCSPFWANIVCNAATLRTIFSPLLIHAKSCKSECQMVHKEKKLKYPVTSTCQVSLVKRVSDWIPKGPRSNLTGSGHFSLSCQKASNTNITNRVCENSNGNIRPINFPIYYSQLKKKNIFSMLKIAEVPKVKGSL